jgi:hypothetical protein
MEFFTPTVGEVLTIGGLTVRCDGASTRSAFFIVLRLDEGCCRQEGWIDATWCGDAESGKVFLRIAIMPEIATIRRANDIRIDLYAKLGIPSDTLFQKHVVNFRHSTEIHDGRGCMISSVVECDGDPAFDPLDRPLFGIRES